MEKRKEKFALGSDSRKARHSKRELKRYFTCNNKRGLLQCPASALLSFGCDHLESATDVQKREWIINFEFSVLPQLRLVATELTIDYTPKLNHCKPVCYKNRINQWKSINGQLTFALASRVASASAAIALCSWTGKRTSLLLGSKREKKREEEVNLNELRNNFRTIFLKYFFLFSNVLIIKV